MIYRNTKLFFDRDVMLVGPSLRPGCMVARLLLALLFCLPLTEVAAQSEPVEVVIAPMEEDTTVGGLFINDRMIEGRLVAGATSSGLLQLLEGSSRTYTIRLSQNPGGNVTVNFTTAYFFISANGANFNVDLMFTNLNWNIPQRLVVFAREDDNIRDNTATVIVTTDGSGSYDRSREFNIRLIDKDKAFLVLTPTTVSVAEGGSASYTVALASEPTGGAVTVTISGHSGTDLTPSPVSLTFTTVNWGTAQTVMVTAGSDDDAGNDTVTLTHTASGGGSLMIPGDVQVTITDSDMAGVTISQSGRDTTVGEDGDMDGGTDTYTVVLDTQPADNVEIMVTSDTPLAATASPTTLTFTSGNWNTVQTVTVTGVDDDIDNIDNPGDSRTATLTHRISRGDSGTYPAGDLTSASASFTVTVTDDDTAVVIISEDAVTIGEDGDMAGGTDTYTVVLNTQPTSNVEMTVTSNMENAATASPVSLTFTSGNWDTAQTVTVTGVNDDIDNTDDSRTATIMHRIVTGSAGYSNANDVDPVMVTVTDNDDADLVFSSQVLTVDEGDSTDYTVALASEPTGGAVTVTISGHSGTDLTPSPVSLTFTTVNWDTVQTVMVNAAEDDDAVNDSETLEHTASGGDYRTITGDVQVTITDSDMAGVTIIQSGGGTTVGEDGDMDGGTDTYTVVLATQPASNVEIMVTSDMEEAATASPTTLTFTSGNWNTVQTVTVTGVDDDIDNPGNTRTATLAHSISRGDSGTYPAGDLTSASFTVTVADDDTAGVIVSEDAVTVGEDGNMAGGTATYTMMLNTQPISNVEMTVTSNMENAATASPARLTFTPGNWDTVQTVTVTGVNDDIDNTGDSRTATIMHRIVTGDGGGYLNANDVDPVTVAVTDNDDAGLVFSSQVLTVDEGDSTDYTVALASEPTGGAVTVTISGHSGTDLTPSPVSLTFTTVNWDTVQTVMVNAAEDDDAVNDSETLEHTASGGDYRTITGDVQVTITDSDMAGVTIIQSGGGTTVGEDGDMDGGTDTYTVVLATQPASNVEIMVTSDMEEAATASPTTLTFTSGNWNTVQTVTVTGVDDDIDNPGNTRTATLAHSISRGDSGTYPAGDLTSASFTVTVADDDTAGVIVSEDAVTVGEDGNMAGGTATYTMMLNTQPISNVEMTVTSNMENAATASPARLTFTPGNWDTVQTVTVTGVNDDIDNTGDSRTATIMHRIVTGDGGGYLNANDVDPVTVAVTDNDDAGLVFSNQMLTVDEGDSTDYTVALASEPTGGAVTVTISGHSGTDLTPSPVSLTFTTVNWDTVQTVMVNAAEDDDAVNDSETLEHTASGGDYRTITGDVQVTITDSDMAGVTISQSDGGTTVGEDGDMDGGTDTYTVVLDTQPADNVEIMVTSDMEEAATASPTTLTFTSGNWNTVQTVTVTGVDDDIDNPGNTRTATLAHSISRGDSGTYPAGDLTSASFTVTVADDDTAGVIVSEDAVTVGEDGNMAGGTATYTMMLNTQPISNVEMTVTSNMENAATASPARLTFTPGNWDTVQTVTVTGVNDDIDNTGDSRTATIMHRIVTGDGGGYLNANDVDPVTVAVTDNDDAGLVFSSQVLTVDEGDSTDYTVALASEPTGGAVTVTISGHSGTDLTPSPVSLTFTTVNWDTVQTVMVNAAEDDDAVNDSETLEHTASGGDYRTITGDVQVTITDSDMAGVTIIQSGGGTTVGEDGDMDGGTDTYTVVLATQPASNVEIMVTSDMEEAATASPTTLTFTSGNWNTVQTVTVTGVDDDIDNPGNTRTATLAHSISRGDSGTYPAGDLTSASFTVTVADDDTAGVIVSEDAVTVGEDGNMAGGTATYTMMLNTQPISNVEMTVTSNMENAATASPARLTFTPGNWDTVQTVTVTGVNDDIDNTGDSRTATIMHRIVTGDGGGYLNANDVDPVTVAVTDNDDAGLVFSNQMLTVDEGDSTDYTVALASEPTGGAVTVTISGHSGTDLTPSPVSLTFTTVNWDTVQTVMVNAAEDDDAVNDSETLEHTASGGDYRTITGDVQVTITDSDMAGVTISQSDGGTTVGEDGDMDGGTDTYTVVLDTQPADNVEIMVTSDMEEAATASPTTLTFTSGNWNTVQTVTVTGVDDDIDNPGNTRTATLAHSISRGDSGTYPAGDLTSASFTVTVADDDTAGVIVSEDAVTVGEDGNMAGGTATYTMMLNTQPISNVEMTVTSNMENAATASPARLTFTPGNWDTVQTVTVTGVNDDIDNTGDSRTATIMHRIVTGDGGGYLNANDVDPVTVAVTDNDDAGLVFSNQMLTVDEGDSTDYTVALASEPTGGAVTVTISGHSGTDLTPSPVNLTFTTVNWDTVQTVMVNAAEDDDAVNDSETLEHTASGGDYRTITGDVQVTITDSDMAGVTIIQSGGGTTVGEDGDMDGGTDTYTVVLATQPADNVEIMVTSDMEEAATASPTTLTFTSGNWNTVQTVTVTGVDDDIDNTSNTRTATLAHSISRGDSGTYPAGGLAPASFTVTVADDDTAGVIVSEDAVTVGEDGNMAGGTATYTMVLNTQPTSNNVEMTVTSNMENAATASPANLTFTSGNWDTAQTVTVTGVNDDIDNPGDSRTATIIHRIVTGSAGYSNANDVDPVAVTVTDNDDAGLVFSNQMLTVDEGDSTDYTVALASEPTGGAVTVTISGHSGTDLTPSPVSLTFTTVNWDTVQTVMVTAGSDDDAGNDTATLEHMASGGDYRTVTGDVQVTITDNDMAGVTISQSDGGTTVGEDGDMDGGTDTYTVVLDTQPAGNVEIMVTSNMEEAATASPTTLTFTSGNWNTVQTVTVTGVDDDIDNPGDSRTATLTHRISRGDSGTYPAGDLTSASFTVTVTDDDDADLVFSNQIVTVDEGDSTDYTVALASEPIGGAVTVTISGHSGTDLTPSPVSLTFTTVNWGTAQMVMVTARPDDDAGNDSVTLTHMASGGDYRMVTGDVQVTITDNDTVGLMLTPTMLTVVEGARASYTVALVTQPTASVTVAITGQDGTDLTLGETSLTFTTNNWNMAQTVTVDADEDADAVNDSASLMHMATGGGYDSVESTVTVNTTDNDTASLVLTPTMLAVAEGASASYTVELVTQPTASVTVAITGHGGTDLTLGATSLTFTTNNWNTAQMVMVDADEDDDAVNDSASLMHMATGGGYDSVEGTVTVNTTDNDTVGLMLTPTALTVAEGGSASYTVVLASEPTGGTVTVVISGHGGTDLTLGETSLAFTTNNWNTVQTVTVDAGEDDDGNNDSAILMHMASGGDYGSVRGEVTVNTTDDDMVDGMAELEVVQELWLSRFGLTAVEHILSGLNYRWQGHATDSGVVGPLSIEGLFDRSTSGSLRLRDLLSGSRFVFSDGDGVSVWGQSSYTSYRGAQEGVSLDGEVTSGVLGMDRDMGRTLLGVALSYSDGEGDWRGEQSTGEVSSHLTSLTPYIRHDVTDRLQAWGAAGYGYGNLRLSPTAQDSSGHDIEQLVALAGLRGTLLDRPAEESGLTLTVTSDAALVRTESDDSGQLSGVAADTQRLRLGLEWSWLHLRADGSRLVPELQLGVRYDGGDVTHGLGMELGSGISWELPSRGLTLDLRGRHLLGHGDSERREWGVSGSLRYDLWPGSTPDSMQGPSLSLHQEYGNASASGGLGRLLSDSLPDSLEPDSSEPGPASGRWNLEGEWGFALDDGATGVPYAGLSSSGSDRDLTLGWRLLSALGGPHTELDIKAVRREDDSGEADHGIGAELKLRW